MHGFHNNGNTCYFNSALQCVLRMEPFVQHVLKNPYTGECGFTKVFSDLVKLYRSTDESGQINIQPLLDAFRQKFPRFKKYLPHDAQEALFCIIDILETEYPYLKKLVYGVKTQYTVSPAGTKTVEEPFSFLILNNTNTSDDIEAMMHKSEDWSVLTNYVDDDGVKHNVTTTRSAVTTYPQVLFVSFDKKQTVNVGEFKQYELVGSILHMGSQRGGHYVSLVKKGSEWVLQDDETLRKTTFPTKSSHHVLMYMSKNLTCECPP